MENRNDEYEYEDVDDEETGDDEIFYGGGKEGEKEEEKRKRDREWKGLIDEEFEKTKEWKLRFEENAKSKLILQDEV